MVGLSRRTLLATGVVTLGVALLAHPLYLPAGDAYNPTFDGVRSGECGSWVAYGDLPARAQRSFDRTPHGHRATFDDTLYAGADDAAIEAFRRNDCVRADGRYYEIGLIHRDGTSLRDLVPGTLLSLAGLLAVAAGAAVGRPWRRLR